jgi:hypothetical protein
MYNALLLICPLMCKKEAEVNSKMHPSSNQISHDVQKVISYLHDEGCKDGVMIHHDSSTTGESLYDLSRTVAD